MASKSKLYATDSINRTPQGKVGRKVSLASAEKWIAIDGTKACQWKIGEKTEETEAAPPLKELDGYGPESSEHGISLTCKRRICWPEKNTGKEDVQSSGPRSSSKLEHKKRLGPKLVQFFRGLN